MKHQGLLICLLLTTGLVSICAQNTPTPGENILGSFSQDEYTRNYLLYVPSSYDGSEAWPLVINMHGLGGNKFEQKAFTGMHLVADTAKFLIVFPEASLGEVPAIGTAPSWNSGMLPERADDVAFIDQLIDTLLQNWNVDEQRIYATGMSQGGVMSYLLACQIPDRLAAIASVSGVSLLNIDWTCTADRPLPVMHIHGTADVITPYTGGSGILGPQAVFPPVRDQLAVWLNNNGCAADSTVSTFPDLDLNDGSTVEIRQFRNCTSYAGSDGTERVAEVRLYTVFNGGHSWPGGSSDAVEERLLSVFGNFNQDFNASAEIWNFFRQHQLPASISSVKPLEASSIHLEVAPNPFHEVLTFRFELEEAADVNLVLYNTLGQPVAQIMDAHLAAGSQLIEWRADRSILVPGWYYYGLQIDEKRLSRPLIRTR
ncbi:MAG: PHB depolymerase family esterase [Saprospiraceae bacterium]|nr:hypothetical protein [Lewinella sp.]